jgi:hypothetical protein
MAAVRITTLILFCQLHLREGGIEFLPDFGDGSQNAIFLIKIDTSVTPMNLITVIL